MDVDVGQGELSVPGALAAVPVDRASLSVEDAGGVSAFVTLPLVYAFGHATPSEYSDVYRNSQSRLADTVLRRLSSADRGSEAGSARVGGLIINTMGWVDGGGYALLLDAVAAFRTDVIVVLGHDKVYARLCEDVKSAAAKWPVTTPAAAAGRGSPAPPPVAISVVKLAKPGGVVERSPAYRREARRARIREYFYGPPLPPGRPPTLSPASLVVSFDSVTLVRIGGAASEVGILPIGKASTLDPLRVTTVAPSTLLLHTLAAVSFASSEKQVQHVNVAGFVHM